MAKRLTQHRKSCQSHPSKKQSQKEEEEEEEEESSYGDSEIDAEIERIKIERRIVAAKAAWIEAEQADSDKLTEMLKGRIEADKKIEEDKKVGAGRKAEEDKKAKADEMVAIARINEGFKGADANSKALAPKIKDGTASSSTAAKSKTTNPKKRTQLYYRSPRGRNCQRRRIYRQGRGRKI
jgi:hypothetical protein